MCIRDRVNSKNIMIEDRKIVIGNINAKYVVMCIGINQKNLDLFSNLPLRPESGNSILAEVNFNSTHIVNNKISVINTSKNNVHAGSTYHNGFENMGTEKIEKQLKEIVQKKYKIKEYKFGVRPATRDRRPFVGRHSNIDNLYILNGLGSKGVSQSPYCSKELLNYIEFNKNLDQEINIERIKT